MSLSWRRAGLGGIALWTAISTTPAWSQSSGAETAQPQPAQTAPSASTASPTAQPPAQPAADVAGASVTTPGAAAAAKTYTVPVGTKVLLQLKSGINTRSAKPGDGVYLTSTFPVVIGPRVMIPAGVYVQGIVDRVQRAGRVKGKAQLDMHFTSMIFPNGTVVEIPGVVNSVPDAKKQTVKNDGEGTIEQDSDKGRNAGETAKIAIPTGGTVGAIGGLGSGHPLEGGLVGLAAGGAAVGIVSLFTRGADVEIPAGSQVEMVLQRPLLLEEENLRASAMDGGAGSATAFVPAANQPKPLAKPELRHTPGVCPPGGLGCE
jgi:hypothetical protein